MNGLRYRARLKGTGLVGDIAVTATEGGVTRCQMDWDGVGIDSRWYAISDLERAERGPRFDSQLYDSNDRYDIECNRALNAADGFTSGKQHTKDRPRT